MPSAVHDTYPKPAINNMVCHLLILLICSVLTYSSISCIDILNIGKHCQNYFKPISSWKKSPKWKLGNWVDELLICSYPNFKLIFRMRVPPGVPGHNIIKKCTKVKLSRNRAFCNFLIALTFFTSDIRRMTTFTTIQSIPAATSIIKLFSSF